MTYEPQYIQYLFYFNVERDYFECHEVMEELWIEEGRDPLYQGLLQVAVGLYHARNDNVSGAIKLFTQALDKLTRYPEHQLGIDLSLLIEESRMYVERLRLNEESPFPFEDITIIITDPVLAQAVSKLIS
jgi:uncharacterized protein